MKIDDAQLQIGKLSLKPGDVLVAKFTPSPSQEVARRAAEYIRPLLPEGVKLMVVGPEVDLSVITAEPAPRRAKRGG